MLSNSYQLVQDFVHLQDVSATALIEHDHILRLKILVPIRTTHQLKQQHVGVSYTFW